MPKRMVDLRSQQPLLDIVSYGRGTPGERLTLAQRQSIERTASRAPEVMIKVGRGGATVGAVAAHFRYLNRQGELEIETDEGNPLRGAGTERDLLEDWGLAVDEQESRAAYSGLPGRRGKLVHKLTFSMPAGTPPKSLLAAVREFATEKWGARHRYAMVLHTDQPHPHVHVVLKAVNERGERLNIRKFTLREWRRDFAAALREQGVAANATERAVRGESRTRPRDGIYRAMRRGDSTHFELQARAIAESLRRNDATAEPGKQKLLGTRAEVEQGWKGVAQRLRREGHAELAKSVDGFVAGMSPPHTDREWLASELRMHLRKVRERDAPSR